MTPPPPEVLHAFGLQGSPRPIPGGRDLCYQVGPVVLKPSDDDDEVQWLSELAAELLRRAPTSYRLAAPFPLVAAPGRYLFDGWSASSFVSGTSRREGRFEELFRASRAFHADLAALVHEKPVVVGKQANRWNKADRVVWGESTLDEIDGVNEEMLVRFQPLLDKLGRLTKALPVGVKSQLVHADMFGNVLFDDAATSPAIIDLTFYWRPAEYANAVVVADALAWAGAGRGLVELYGTDELRLQLLVRAMHWRYLTFVVDTDLAWVRENLHKADYETAVNVVGSFLKPS